MDISVNCVPRSTRGPVPACTLLPLPSASINIQNEPYNWRPISQTLGYTYFRSVRHPTHTHTISSDPLFFPHCAQMLMLDKR